MKLDLRVALALVCALPLAAKADLPDPALSSASSASGCVTIGPQVAGSLADGGLTVSVTILDGSGQPVVGYPAADIVLLPADDASEVSFCPGGGWIADAATDANGQTTIRGLAYGGGSSAQGLRVHVSGVPLQGAVLPLSIVSPDMGGDGYINMRDLTAFAIIFVHGEGYAFEADFNCDGVKNLLDVVVLGNQIGNSCP